MVRSGAEVDAEKEEEDSLGVWIGLVDSGAIAGLDAASTMG
jgi:hypothetical protein